MGGHPLTVALERMATTTTQPVWRSVLLWAGMAIAADIFLFMALIAIGHLSGSQIRSSVGTWVSLHEPALVLATALLPSLPSAHSPPPLASYIGFGLFSLAQMAVLGGVLGYVYTVMRRRQIEL